MVRPAFRYRQQSEPVVLAILDVGTMIVRRRIDIAVAGGSKPGSFQRGAVGWIKAIIGAILVIAALVAVLLLGIALGTILAILIGTLVAGAIVVLVLRGVLNRSRARP
jgi:zinc transporter ZupT